MLPGAVGIAAGVEVVGADAGRAVHVHVGVAAVPVPAAEHGSAGRDAQAEHHAAHQRRAVVGRRRVIRWRIGRIGPRAIGPGRIVVGHVDRLRIGRFDHDRAAAAGRLRRHRLLRRALEVAGGRGLGAQALHGIGHVLLLRDHRVADLLGPVELVVHHLEDLRKRRQRLDADVPVLVLDRGHRRIALEIGIGLRPARRLDDFERIARGHQRLRQQGIGIQRDRRQHLVELLGRVGLLGVLRPQRVNGAQCQDRRRNGQQIAPLHVRFVLPKVSSGRRRTVAAMTPRRPACAAIVAEGARGRIMPGDRLRPARRGPSRGSARASAARCRGRRGRSRRPAYRRSPAARFHRPAS